MVYKNNNGTTLQEATDCHHSLLLKHFWLSLLLGDLRYIEKKLSECTRKNDEFNSLPKMTNSINCTKFRNN